MCRVAVGQTVVDDRDETSESVVKINETGRAGFVQFTGLFGYFDLFL